MRVGISSSTQPLEPAEPTGVIGSRLVLSLTAACWVSFGVFLLRSEAFARFIAELGRLAAKVVGS